MKNLWKVLVGLFSFFGGIASLALFLVSLMDVSFGVGEDSGSKVMSYILLFVFGPLAYYCFKTFFSRRRNTIAQRGETLIEQANNKSSTVNTYHESSSTSNNFLKRSLALTACNSMLDNKSQHWFNDPRIP